MNKYLMFFMKIGIVAAALLPWIYLYDWAVENNMIKLANTAYYVTQVELWSLFLIVGYVIGATILHAWKYSQHNIKIKKGNNFDFWYFVTRLWWTPSGKGSFRVRFSKDTSKYVGYSVLGPYFEESWNKLGGVCYRASHYYSDRIGFRFNGKDMQTCSYQYRDGVRSVSNISVAPWGEWITFRCNVEDVLEFDLKWYHKLLCLKNNPMFGGRYPSPNNLGFEYQIL